MRNPIRRLLKKDKEPSRVAIAAAIDAVRESYENETHLTTRKSCNLCIIQPKKSCNTCLMGIFKSERGCYFRECKPWGVSIANKHLDNRRLRVLDFYTRLTRDLHLFKSLKVGTKDKPTKFGKYLLELDERVAKEHALRLENSVQHKAKELEVEDV